MNINEIKLYNDDLKETASLDLDWNKLKDKTYVEFQAKLIPTIKKETIIGVRTPDLKNLAKKLSKASGSEKKDVDKFLDELPHKYFDENQLHAFILSEIKDFDICIKNV